MTMQTMRPLPQGQGWAETPTDVRQSVLTQPPAVAPFPGRTGLGAPPATLDSLLTMARGLCDDLERCERRRMRDQLLAALLPQVRTLTRAGLAADVRRLGRLMDDLPAADQRRLLPAYTALVDTVRGW